MNVKRIPRTMARYFDRGMCVAHTTRLGPIEVEYYYTPAQGGRTWGHADDCQPAIPEEIEVVAAYKGHRNLVSRLTEDDLDEIKRAIRQDIAWEQIDWGDEY